MIGYCNVVRTPLSFREYISFKLPITYNVRFQNDLLEQLARTNEHLKNAMDEYAR